MAINKRKNPLQDLNDIDWSKTAILVIDECGDPSEALPETGLLSMVQHTATLLTSARSNKIPVIFACDEHFKEIDHELALWGNHGIKGTTDAEVSPQLNYGNQDYLIHKRRYSSFFGTSLDLLLDELEVTTLILCGFDTNICVSHTAADAYYRNYSLIVAQDATTSFLYGTQENALALMNKLYGALISNVADLCNAMER